MVSVEPVLEDGFGDGHFLDMLLLLPHEGPGAVE